MMHLMVNSRHMLTKKTTSDNETLNEGLVAFALDNEESDLYKQQQILSNAPRRNCQCPNPDILPSPRNYGEDFEHVAYSANGDGDGSDRSLRKKPFGGNRGHRRSAPLEALQMDTIYLGPTLTSSLAFKEPRNTSPMTAKLSADDSTGKFAYISLDGRLINANLATSVTGTGGKLRDEEARAWEDFVPVQLVLIVAVAAAVSAAAKHRKINEIDRLLKTVENRVLRNREHCMSSILAAIASFVNIIMSSLHTFFWTLVTTLGISSLWTLRWTIVKGRLKLFPYMTCSQEKELISLSQELNEICKLNNTNTSRLCRDHLEPFSSSPKTPPAQKKVGSNFSGDNGNGNLDLQEGWSSTKYVTQPVVESSLDLFSITTPISDEERAKEESKWYVNPLVEYSQDSDDDSFTTPERCNSLFPSCNPAAQGSFEQTVSRSSFSNGETDVSTGLLPVNLPPSGSDNYLLNEAQGASSCNDISKIEENIVAWRQYLERNHGTEAISEGDEEKSPNKLSDEEDITDLAKQLQSKEVEIADLKKGRKVLLEAKNREIEELKELLRSRDAELEKLLAVAETTKTANADRLAILEELCRDKDSIIFDLKHVIQSLEWKVQKSRVYQSPTVLRGRRYSAPFIHSSSSDHGASQKQMFSDKYYPSSGPISNHILEHKGRFKKGVPSNTGHLPHLNTRRLEYLADDADDGRSELGYDHQEPSLDYSFLLGSSIGDDCSVNSLAYSEPDVDRRFGSKDSGSFDDSISKDHFSGMKGSLNNWTFQRRNSMSSDLRRATTSFTGSAYGFTRSQSCKNNTSTEESAFKPLNRNLSGEMKVIKNPNSTVSSPGSSPQARNLKGLGSMAVQHFRSSSLDTNLKSNYSSNNETSGGLGNNGSSLSHKQHSATKRKQWV